MLKRLLNLVRAMTRAERWTLGALAVLAVVSTIGLLRLFYLDKTVLVATAGGTYIEGSVGSSQPLNPWFTVQNDVNRDIVSLVFAGLLRYDPQTKKIVEDLATVKPSADGKTYTLELKPDLFWHDSTDKQPHPVTAADVLYTFQTIQKPGFPNLLLQQNFRGVKIVKLDDRTVQFQLETPYSFFPSNLTLGLVPASAFEGVPVNRLDQALDFGFHPIGAGPYKFKSTVQTDLSTEVTLEKFPRPIPPEYHLDRIVLRIYPDYTTLLSDLRTLHGVRLVPRNRSGEPIIPKRFRARSYVLPQYVALFFNLDRPALQDQKLRLGLQLGTDKKQIVDAIHETHIVDTGLLELASADWQYRFDPESAQGALFASRWNLPEKIRLQHLLEIEEANKTGAIRAKNVVYLEAGAVVTLSGSVSELKGATRINGVTLDRHPTATGSWMVALPTVGTGGIAVGENLLRLTDTRGKIVDSFYLRRVATKADYARAAAEQELVADFLRGKTLPESQRLTPQDMTLEAGYLRRRSSADPVSVRLNDKGQPLQLTLLTTSAPPEYAEIAETVKKQWARLGVAVTVDIPPSRDEFQDRLLRRDYDVLLFGESLLDNLDAFPYWHSSGRQRLTALRTDLRSDAFNLSQYASFKADALLEAIRRTSDDRERAKALGELQNLLKEDVPAVFLYSPTYTFAHQDKLRGVEIGSISLHSDRFLTLYKWYVKEHRQFVEGTGWLSFFGWLPSLIAGEDH